MFYYKSGNNFLALKEPLTKLPSGYEVTTEEEFRNAKKNVYRRNRKK